MFLKVTDEQYLEYCVKFLEYLSTCDYEGYLALDASLKVIKSQATTVDRDCIYHNLHEFYRMKGEEYA